jgi:hypothetical protein
MKAPPENDDRFATTVRELIDSLEDAFKKERDFAALILLYAEMDFISSLSRPVSQPDTNEGVFEDWVARYMLPDSNLKCKAVDIYAARCGVLHTLSVASKKSRSGIAKTLGYAYKRDEVNKLQSIADSKGQGVVVVSMPDYREAFYKGICRFLEQMKIDADLNARVAHHFTAVAAVAYLPSTSAPPEKGG